ncbi:MAG: sugar transferase [Dysgonamonadaceae bacterium]|jgi:exopolysaccharide biosynthesis polyprenyl glycosylphosphotransferase|nr:sugar transferase [Dysgonamonadaceae bacterium]
MKRILYILVDIIIIYGCILFTFFLLEKNDSLAEFQRNFAAFKIVYPFIGLFYLVLMYAFGLYNLMRKELFELFYTVFLVSISLTIGIMGICFFVRDVALAFPRSVILLSALFYFILLSIWRFLLWFIDIKLHGVKKIFIFGMDRDRLVNVIETKYAHFYKIEGIENSLDPGIWKKLKSVDCVFVCADVLQKIRQELVPFCIKYQKEFFYVPKYFDLSLKSSSLLKTDDIPTFHIPVFGLSPEENFVKRVVDIFWSFIAFVFFLPFGIIVSLLIKLDGGPIFYTQERLTRNGKVFNIYKFRTMIPDAEKSSGPVLAGDKDNRITKLGKFLRAVRLDEIPQLFNILKGDMSIVGPRPERPFFACQFEKEIPEYRYRLRVKAGLTGLAQVEGKYNTTVEDKLRYDLIYINTYSVLRDLLIMLQTVKILFMRGSTEGVNTN